MKKHFLIGSFVILALATFFVGCSKDPINADEAQQSVREAKTEMMQNMTDMLQFDGMEAIMFMMDIMGMDLDVDIKSSLAVPEKNGGYFAVAPWLDFTRQVTRLKSGKPDPDPKDGGVWQYNYATEQFDLVDPDVDFLRFVLPANQADYLAEGLNGEITISDYEYITISGEEMPTGFSIVIKAFGDTICTIDYEGAFDAEGKPTNLMIEVTMNPYSVTFSFQVSGLTYNVALTMKKNNNTLLAFDFNILMLNTMEWVSTISGYLQITPLRLEGQINVTGLENCAEENIDCINNNIDLELYNLNPKKVLLGTIEARYFQDESGDFIAPALVYSDGTYEGLHEIFWEFTDFLDDWKK